MTDNEPNAPQAWRVEVEGGEVREVSVFHDTVPSRVGTAFLASGWFADGAGMFAYGVPSPTPRGAVIAVLPMSMPVVSILAPGEPTRAEIAEQLAAANRRIEEYHQAFRREYLLLREVADFAVDAVARSGSGVEVKAR